MSSDQKWFKRPDIPPVSAWIFMCFFAIMTTRQAVKTFENVQAGWTAWDLFQLAATGFGALVTIALAVQFWIGVRSWNRM